MTAAGRPAMARRGARAHGAGMSKAHLFFLFVVVGCAAAPPVAPVPSPSPSPSPVAPVPSVHAAVVDGLVGAWAGELDSPFGAFPFEIEFVREPDGSVHGRAEKSPQEYFDFQFRRTAGGGWQLREEGSLPGVGVQTQVLAPAGDDDGRARWASEGGHLVVTVEVDGDAMLLAARLRGEDHATFRLRRVQAVSSP